MTEDNEDDAFVMPDRIAVDAKGYGWRVWNDQEMWSMVPTNPDNSPIPQPVKWFVPFPESVLDAVTTAMCTNGADRLLEMVGMANRREAIACITGIVRAAVGDPMGRPPAVCAQPATKDTDQ